MRKLILVLSLLVLVNSVYAEIVPFEIVVNHTTKECAALWRGDESEVCYPPADWEKIALGEDTSICPEEYTVLENELEGDCKSADFDYDFDQTNDQVMFLGGLGIGLVLIIVVVLGFFIYFFMRKKKPEF